MGHDFETTLDDVRHALRYLDCNDRDTWVKAAFAIKSHFGDAGFSEWDDWSQGYPKYRAGDARAVWRSAKVSGARGTVNLGSLFAMAKQDPTYQPLQKGLTDAEREQLRKDYEARREAVLAQQAADEAWCAMMADKVADMAAFVVANHLQAVGSCPYIGKKRIRPFGALFLRETIILIVDIKNDACRLIVGAQAAREYWDWRKSDEGKAASEYEFSLTMSKGCMVLPMRDMQGRIRNLQVITRAKKEAAKKLFIKCGQKSGTYMRLGEGEGAKLVCEGYATGASLHQATGLPVWVTWDCGGLLNFAKDVGEGDYLFCGDDDYAKKGNPGKTKAREAAQLVGGRYVLPAFPSGIERGTDFNDLHVACGLEVVKAQIDEALAMPAMAAPVFNDAPPPIDDVPPEYASGAHANDDSPATPLESSRPTLEKALQRYAFIAEDAKIWDSHSQKVLKPAAFKAYLTPAVFKEWLEHEQRRDVCQADIRPQVQAAAYKGVAGLGEALERYVYLSISQNVWDSRDRKVVAINDLRIEINNCFNEWVKHPQRKQIKIDNLVFDPKQNSPVEGYINRFNGLPLKPERNDLKCMNMRRLMEVLCNHDQKVVDWLTKWLAYPLQNVGAKMRTSVLMHSDVHGSGKSLFFDGIIGPIYGDYCNVFGQAQLESNYNDWMSECLFGVFEEVLSRSQKFNYTGTLKEMITGTTFYVTKKFMSGWKESNHMNMVFISNEVQPLPVEPSDRRFLVVWPELKLIEELKKGVDHELKNGGIKAFYAWLLDVELGDFSVHTEPPTTEAKQRLIDFGKPAWQAFYEEWKGGDLEEDGYFYQPVRVRDLYKAFERYCRERNEHCMGMNKFNQLICGKEKRQRDVHYEFGLTKGKATFFMVGDCPADKTKQEWLGDCINKWDKALNKTLANRQSEAA